MGHPDHAVVHVPSFAPDLAAVVETALSDPQTLRAELADLLRSDDEVTERPGQVCVTLWVFDASRTHLLLLQHPRLGWCVPGGHLIEAEPAIEGAGRELAEETGLRFDLPMTALDRTSPVFVHANPVPASVAGPAHWHWSVGFLVVADPSDLLEPEPGQPVRWFALDHLPPDAVDDLPGLLGAISALGPDALDTAVHAAGRPHRHH